MSVYKAINAVQHDLCKEGITKDSTNSFDNYKFRGIDAVYNALSPLLAKHGLCILPRMLSREVTQHPSQKGGNLFYVVVDAEFDFVYAEDGSKHTVKTFGEAMDRGDKATNKAMSAAYKYAAFQTFAIPTEGDNDADSTSHDIKGAAGKGVHKPTDIADQFKPNEEEVIYLQSVIDAVLSFKDDFAQASDKLISENLDAEEKVYVWDKLDSKTRSGIKKYNEALKAKEA
jgi:hypothetical protein